MNGLCGCCQPPALLTPLPIYNRPGLSAVAYRIGKYASFRETMLEAIAQTPELAGLGTRRDDDDSITFLDLWAAVADVLTFYQERYANEVFLRTAQQPQSLRRLAGLLGYDPRPGVAALAELAFTADSGKIIQVPVGLRVQSAPAQNQQPQTFETLEAATVDWRFNSLRVFPQPVAAKPLAFGSTEIILDRLNGPAIAAGLAANDAVVLFNNSGLDLAEEKKIAEIKTEDDRIIVRWTTPVSGINWDANTQIWKFKRKFRLFGYNAPSTYMQPSNDASVPGGIKWNLINISDYSYPRISGILPHELDDRGFQDVLYLDARYNDIPSGVNVLTADPSGTVFATGVIIDAAPDIFGNMSDTVTRIEIDTEVGFDDRRAVMVYELVGQQIAMWPNDYTPSINTGSLYLPGIAIQDGSGSGVEVGRTIQQNGFVPGVVIHPQDIEVGRKLLLTDAQNQPVKATLHSPPVIDPPSAPPGSFAHLVITVDANSVALQTKSALLLGNVLLASQGETVHDEVLGSGNASQKFQNFVLQKQPLTYVPGTGPNGVVSSLNVRVNGLLWQEVQGLYEQPATAQVYSTSTAENGRRVVQTGDGDIGGAVLPTGTGNVTATYRVGAGGRVSANALTTLLDRLQGLTSVTNPLSAEGGADAETLEMVRSNAPRTVRTFGRAVSLKDFEDLITASGEVAKAEATWIWDGLAPAVYLTVAGQAGGTFSNPALLAANLNTSRDPNRRLLVGNYQSVPIRISATILASPQYVQDDVLKAALSALLTALSFDSLNLGESIHLSKIYSVLQAV
ncbi:MAG TPA: baseplate J/gp47 family protein, partial [Terriglobales bacterium]|nr:baseplate J/gp47 family protein [Terriglobales bacterium]